MSEDGRKNELRAISAKVVKAVTWAEFNEVAKFMDDQIIDKIYSGEGIYVTKNEIELQPNQFIMMISNYNDKKTALVRFINYNTPLKKINEYKHGIFGLFPRNKEQMFSLDLLLDQNVPVVSIIGGAGSGKSLCSIAAGLEQTIERKKYNKFVIIRPIQPVGKDIGFLPGDMSEKLKPWIAPIVDNITNLIGPDGKELLEEYTKRGIIEIDCLTYIRGRSISNAYILIDEAQNLTLHEIKTLITRVGENTKIVINGDVEQIDNIYVNEVTNGLTIAIEKMKQEHLTGHITLVKGERSPVANLGVKLL